MATAKDILTLNKSKSILQRIGAMWSSIYCGKSKDKLNLHNHYKGYGKDKLVDKILQTSYNIINSKSDYIGVVNDFGLEVITRLKSDGYTNVVLLCTETNDELYTVIKFMLKREFDFDNIIRLDEYMTDNFDLVISNPPYELGNEVIMETMKHCKQAVVLMPASKYKKNKLFKNVTSFEVLPWKDYHDCFEDADTHIHLATLEQNTDNYETWQEFELNTYNQKWIKYYRENLRREASWEYKPWCSSETVNNLLNEGCTFLLTIRTAVDGVHKGENCADYRWNMLNEVILDSNERSDRALPKDNKSDLYGALFSIFKTPEEKLNISSYWYSSKIMTEIVRGLNKQSFPNTTLFLPKVDWNRSWTDEEILRDYGYTEDEIKEILN